VINWPIDFPTINSAANSTIAIKLRPLREEDIDPIFQACQDPTISSFTRVPFPYERAMAEDFVRESDVAYRNHVTISFAIDINGIFAGTIGLHSIQLGDHMAEIGYWITQDFRGKGICTTALKMISDFSLDVMGFRRLEALADFDNAASQKVMEKAGFTRDALLKNRATKRDGRQIDMALYSMARG
jgi:RimJ/RimL family protein N-acetyltransferase